MCDRMHRPIPNPSLKKEGLHNGQKQSCRSEKPYATNCAKEATQQGGTIDRDGEAIDSIIISKVYFPPPAPSRGRLSTLEAGYLVVWVTWASFV